MIGKEIRPRRLTSLGHSDELVGHEAGFRTRSVTTCLVSPLSVALLPNYKRGWQDEGPAAAEMLAKCSNLMLGADRAGEGPGCTEVWGKLPLTVLSLLSTQASPTARQEASFLSSL